MISQQSRSIAFALAFLLSGCVFARPDDDVKDPATAIDIARRICDADNHTQLGSGDYRWRAGSRGNYWQVWVGRENEAHCGNPMVTISRQGNAISPCETCVE